MRSLLFVPADGGPKLDKAMASGADAVIVDLEDSIVPERKDRPRAKRRSSFSSKPAAAKQRPRLLVRINGLDTGMTDADLDAIVAGQAGRHCVSESRRRRQRRASRRQAHRARSHCRRARRADQNSGAGGRIGRRACLPPAHFRGASPRLIGLTWGPEDLSAELGAEANRDAQGELTEPYRLARSVCLYAAAAAKLPAIETVYVDFRNSEGLRRDTEAARRDGFTGRLAIHPAQVPVINDVFTPTAAADREGESRGRGLRRAARRRRGRHRRQDV